MSPGETVDYDVELNELIINNDCPDLTDGEGKLGAPRMAPITLTYKPMVIKCEILSNSRD